MKPKILFLCTGNSCRSQMAEGWAKKLQPEEFDAWSAGIEEHGLNPRAMQVMAEAGVDISSHTSKRIEDLPLQEFDYVITLCGHANETCPVFPGNATRIHQGFDDPPTLAHEVKTEEEQIAIYRRVRDEIRAFIESLPEALMEQNSRPS